MAVASRGRDGMARSAPRRGQLYEHDGSMLDLDNIVRLETVLGDRIGYDAYHRINSTMEDLGEWL